jgi:DNA-binding MarR family transcriptional regulator
MFALDVRSRVPSHEPVPLPDSVDRILEEWAREDPDLPVAPVGVITRLGRVRARLDEELGKVFARYDLTAPDFTVIAALRRAGQPYQLPQSVLMNRLALTSGSVSVRLTRLVSKQIVTREANPGDGRGTLVTLTAKGLRLFDQVGPTHLHNEDVLLSALSQDERKHLADLLRKLLVSFEHERATSPLGLTLAPAHVARRMRTAVGLPDVAGLLVTNVAGGSPGAVAGLRPGDLLVEINGEALLSCVTFAQRAAGHRRMNLTVVRGEASLQVAVRRTA